MLFNSAEFLIFFPIVITAYFILPHRVRWVLLLFASYWFYMAWKPEYILLIILSTCIDYFVSLRMAKETNQKKRKHFLFISLFSNLGILFLFKYFNFFNSSLQSLFTLWGKEYTLPAFNLLLPMGISFYTFQTLSYTIDVYRGRIKPEKHFGKFALYVSFFPQLVAGPIERADRLLPQFHKRHHFDYARVTNGLKRMAWGFFKKVVIADRLALLVNTVYNQPTSYEGMALILATIFFAYQIYCDFSGYSDIAIGVAQVMGFDLMENFKRPYFSKSISEFWKRWHISLSSWFQDYLYIPLGGNRVKVPRHFINLFVTFLISGLWHGANWTFVTWGAIHGIYLILGILLKPIKKWIAKKLHLESHPTLEKFIQISVTFSLVLFSWIFFRANSMNDALYIVSNLFRGIGKWTDLSYIKASLSNLGMSKIQLLVALLSICILEGVHIMQRKGSITARISKLPALARYAIYYAFIFSIILFGVFGRSEFIYFQF